jgi:hypothetical protein
MVRFKNYFLGWPLVIQMTNVCIMSERPLLIKVN